MYELHVALNYGIVLRIKYVSTKLMPTFDIIAHIFLIIIIVVQHEYRQNLTCSMLHI